MSEKTKKILNIARIVCVWLVIAVALFMMVFTVISVTTFDKKDRNIFGYKMFIVKSDSMKATDFKAGDLIFSKKVDPSKLKPDDIITFQSLDKENYGEIVTHKIRSIDYDKKEIVTYGTTSGKDDGTPVRFDYVLGKYTGSIPNVGTFLKFLKTTPGYVVCILIPFLLLILSQGINCIQLFRKYKAEQLAAIQAELQKIEAGRAKSDELMQEIRELKAQLALQKGTKEPQESSGSDDQNGIDQ